MTARDRIDVHQHVVPPFWVEGLSLRHSVHRPPPWSPEQAIAFMDERQIAKGLLSLTAPGLSAWQVDERPDMARRVNEYTSGLVAQWAGRFGNFATLPLPDVGAALSELTYVLDVLNAEGVVLYSNYDDIFLGNSSFEPLWEELDRRQAVVFIHPTRTTLPAIDGIPAPFVDFPFATTRTAVDMVLKGVLDRHKNMRVILSHAGGFLPYAIQRVVNCADTLPGSAGVDKLHETFRRFYFDTALSSGPSALPSLKSFADPERILFGSDFPYAPGGPSEEFTATLDASTWLTEGEHAAICQGNAVALFRRAATSARATTVPD
ncbi:amidohydrolase family protein [Streptomyces sp. NPDC056405]|uniref:amidohydrolase family protein n=1 Tax=Streptomyces sp. NPDC056405 TaxID=3345811 RepID=UPI0035E34CAD